MSVTDEELPNDAYAPYDSLVDLELSKIMTRASFSRQTFHTSPPISPQFHAYQSQQHPEVHPLLKLDTLGDVQYQVLHSSPAQILPPNGQLQLSDFELGSVWTPPHYNYTQFINHDINRIADGGGVPFLPYTSDPMSSSQSTYQYFEEGDTQSPWASSPEYAFCRPLATMEDEDDVADDKPYARLIYEALMEAPGHRMMLRDIYEWFRQNTTKPQESGTNGWQNSIRHNLSMNKVCRRAFPRYVPTLLTLA
jgi:hypothetical protein